MTQVWCSPLYVPTNVTGENVGYAAISNLSTKQYPKRNTSNSVQKKKRARKKKSSKSTGLYHMHKSEWWENECLCVYTRHLTVCDDSTTVFTFQYETQCTIWKRDRNEERHAKDKCCFLTMFVFASFPFHCNQHPRKKGNLIFLNQSLLYNEMAPAAWLSQHAFFLCFSDAHKWSNKPINNGSCGVYIIIPYLPYLHNWWTGPFCKN